MKGLYRADAVNRTFVSSDVVADDYQLKDNETFEDPSGKRSPAKLTATGGPWIDATEEEHKAYMEALQKAWEAQNPGALQPQGPSGQDVALAGLLKDMAAIKTDSKSQDQLNASVMRQLADQKVAQDKVNATVLKQLAALTTANKQSVTQQ
jgi:hypothetical protein